MRERQHEDIADHSLPTRRERLRAFATLKSQRQVLIAGVAILGAAALTLGGALWQQDRTPDLVKLGKGVASINAQPVAALDPADPEGFVVASPEPTPSASESPVGSGDASYYGKELAGNRTASGEVFDPSRLTAAHRTLPLGSEVRVTNPKNGRSVIVKINDRGPYHGNRVIDLSTAAAHAIGLIRSGTGRVSLALLMD